MPPIYTVDASVFLNPFARAEVGHTDSARFLAYLEAEAAPIVVPTLVITEVAAAVGRSQRDPVLALEAAAGVGRLDHLSLIALDVRLAEEAARVAARSRVERAVPGASTWRQLGHWPRRTRWRAVSAAGFPAYQASRAGPGPVC